jgi:hypothetical protein
MSEPIINSENHVIRALHPLGTGAKCSCGYISCSSAKSEKHLTELPFNSVMEWHTTMKQNDYSVPVQAGHILSKIIERDTVSFQEAYKKAIDERGIILVGDTYFAHFGYLTKLIEDTRHGLSSAP